MPKATTITNPCKNAKKSADGKRIPCPLTELLSRLGDKWSVLIIVALAEAPDNKFRFSELKKNVEGISQRMLTATLRNLERDGILTRHLYPEIPPRVEYELTSLGMSVLQPMQGFVEWIEDNWSKIHSSREKFDQGKSIAAKKAPKGKAIGPAGASAGALGTSLQTGLNAGLKAGAAAALTSGSVSTDFAVVLPRKQ